MFLSDNMQISTDFGTVGSMLLGGENDFNFSLSNVSDTDKMYNVSASLTLSNGLDLVSSIPLWTYSEDSDEDVYTITNFKDFSPNEVDIPLSFTISSSNMVWGKDITKFGESISVNLNVTWDSLPRGSEDAENVEYYSIFSFSINVNRLELLTSLPTKQLKGAGNSTSPATNSFTYSISVYNSTEISSTFSLESLLPNGFRYLGEYSVISAPSINLPIPIISDLDTNNQQTISWSSITLLQGEFFSIEFSCAIYEKYAENQTFNSGEIIAHGTELTSNLTITGNDIFIEETASLTSMDMIITASQTESTIDIGTMYDLFYTISIGGYFSFENLSLYCEVSDALSILSAPTGDIGEFTANYTPITFQIDSLSSLSSTTKTISVMVDEFYKQDSDYVYSGDILQTFTVIEGTNSETSDIAIDSASHSQQIALPTITQEIVAKTYRDETPKTIDTVAPFDLVTYRLTYDSTNVKAVQKNIVLDDFFPLDCYLPTDENVVQLQGDFITSETVSPHGLRWSLGDFAQSTLWQIDITAQVTEDATTLLNDNLFKLTGEQKNGNTYSLRENTTFTVGQPNLNFVRVVEGVDINAIRSSDVLTGILTITNEYSDTATDGFNFRFIATLANGVTFDPQGITATGTGAVTNIVTNDTTASIEIERLLVGEYVELTYHADFPDLISPNSSFVIASQIEIPYTQTYDVLEDNVKYISTAYKSNYTATSASIILEHYTDKSTAEIGEDLQYTFTATVPVGTIIYNYGLEDVLPEHQTYLGNAFLNGESVTPIVSNNTVIFPELAILDSRNNSQTVEYLFDAHIEEGGTSVQEYQTANGIFSYEDDNEIPYSDFKDTTVVIGNPQLTLSLSNTDNTIYTNKNTTITMNLGNTGNAGITDLNVSLPLPQNVNYISSSTNKGYLIFDTDTNTLTYDLGENILETKDNLSISVVIRANNETYSGDSFIFQAKSSEYKNTESETQIYSGVISNTLTLTATPNLSLSISAIYRNQNYEGYVMVSPNSTVSVPYNVINNGGGIDSYRLDITNSKYPYTINVEDVVYDRVEANSSYSGTPEPLQNLPVGAINTIELVFAIPNTELYDTNPYTVTLTSLTDESVSQSLYTFMIDP